ncbi:thrombospondin type 3 repeat-containing protein [Pseudoalteromonas sp. LC2018020214]|uniref:thrombospondin type 3 repeat-containing protein n=1 Tax=Pseudoalteromonas sp. LC2018020214 TaxID=2799564 RepID=UPI0019032BA4|nr:thrombospondin type 3 repeat-containing protein [Pseudoalteromonas sp. LC2018020214]QQM64751.1 thrombospondin type 3 repeat-containing protein [Pseudoalteromonas sp. LC2018020214]
MYKYTISILCFLLSVPFFLHANENQQCNIYFNAITEANISDAERANMLHVYMEACGEDRFFDSQYILNNTQSSSLINKAATNSLRGDVPIALRSFVASQNINNSNVDTTPPKLVGLKMSSHSIDVSNGQQTITVDVSLYDESGINDARFWFRYPELSLYKQPEESVDWVYNEITNIYDATFTYIFDETSVGGSWELSSVLSISDSIGNRVDINTADITELGFNPILEVVNSNYVDTTAPQLVSLNMSENTVNVTDGQQTITVDVSLQDESGIGSARFWFRYPELSLYKQPEESVDWVYNEITNTYDATFTYIFDETSVGGSWELSSVLSITDSIGNRVDINTADITELGFDPILEVVNSNYVDTTAPQLVLLNMSENTVNVTDGQQTITVDVSLQDESGISSARFWFRYPELSLYKQPEESVDWVYNEITNTYDATFTYIFDETSVGGSWELSSVLSITDSIGNRVDIDTNDIIEQRLNPYISINNQATLIDSKVEAITDFKSLTLDSQVSEFALTIDDSIPYDLWVIASDNTTLTNIEFSGAEGLSNRCAINSGKIKCSFSAFGVYEYLNAKVISRGSDIGLSVFLVPSDSSVEQDWESNFVLFPAADIDGDGVNNESDVDDDNDGVPDIQDAFPYDITETLDTDLDGIGNNKDLDDDNDGISDKDEIKFGLNPLEPNDANNAPSHMLLFIDINDDGVKDWLKYSLVEGVANIYIIDGRDFSAFSFFNISSELENLSIELLGDRNNDGIKEIGLFGFNNAVGRYQLAVYNGYTGQSMGTWNWPETLKDVEFKLLDDLTLDGVQEYAITGIHLTNGTKQLFVKDGVSKQTYKTFKWTNQWLNAQIVQMSDMTNDGVPEVALYGRHERLDKGQLFVFDGANSNNKLDVYNWNKLWNDISLHKMDDLDGDGTTDWGQFGQRKDDGRYQWVVKKGHDKQGVIRTFSWPNDLSDVKPLLLADTTGDNVSEVALYGKNSSGKVFLRVNDGRLANTRIANFSWPATWTEEQVMELGDLNSDGINEVALLGVNINSGKYQLVIKDGRATTEYGRLTLEGNFADLTISSYDANSDGQADVIVNSVNAGTLSRISVIYSGEGLGLLSTTIH